MILVDSSVWIDFFRGTVTPQVDVLDRLLGEEPVAIGDLMMTEVLQGFSNERDFNQAQRMLGALDLVEIGGRDVMVEAARYFRHLRSRGITIRKT
ncbi:type II toxin-antitoxin system VapC family toxin, partial [Komagataeibacter europaeus]|uniref:type II toxin-antitoxin system VapC family toxin n=1 Tax=Komagataeibacter europaeus TaxID=33995 RepID=UPI000237F2EC